MAAAQEILLKWVSESTQAVSDMKRVNRALGDSQTSADRAARRWKTASSVVQTATVAWGGAVVAGAAAYGQMAKAAIEDSKAQAILTQTARNTTAATASQTAAMHEFIDAQARATLFTDDDLRPAMGNLLRATQDQATAQSLLTVAMDASTATGKSAESISTALGKAYNGNGAALKRLFPTIDDAVIKSGNFEKILAAVKEQVDGASKAAADADSLTMLSQDIDELKESLGGLATSKGGVQALKAVRDGVNGLTDWANENPDGLSNIAKGIGGITVAMGGLWGVTKFVGVISSAMAGSLSSIAALGTGALLGSIQLDKWADKQTGALKAVTQSLSGLANPLGNAVRSVTQAAEPLLQKVALALPGAMGDFARDAVSKWHGITDAIGITEGAHQRFVDALKIKKMIEANADPALRAVNDSMTAAQRYHRGEYRPKLDADPKPAKDAADRAQHWVDGVRQSRPVRIDGDTSPLRYDIEGVKSWIGAQVAVMSVKGKFIGVSGGVGVGAPTRLLERESSIIPAGTVINITVSGAAGDSDMALARKVAGALDARERALGRKTWVRTR